MITAMQWTSSSPCPCTACISMSLVAVFVTWELWSLSCRWRPPTVLKYSPCSAVKKLDSLEYKWTLFLTVDLGVISLSLDSVIWVNGEQREEIVCFFYLVPIPVLLEWPMSCASPEGTELSWDLWNITDLCFVFVQMVRISQENKWFKSYPYKFWVKAMLKYV